MKINNNILKKGIIYIIGAGRSGTTLLDIILGNSENVFSAGELNRYTKRDGEPHSPRDNNVSDFWCDIKKELKQHGYDHPIDIYNLSSKFEYHSFFTKIFFFFSQKDFEVYRKFQKSLFAAIWETAKEKFNKEIIIDSSKYPVRAYFLSKVFGKNISFIFIQRNPLAVVDSFQVKNIEQPSKTRLGAHIYVLGVNKLALMVLRKLQKNNSISKVSYERLLQDPASELQKIEADLGIDLSLSKEKISKNLPLQVGYLFDGNRLRSEKTIVFRQSLCKTPIKKTIDKISFQLHKTIWFKN